MVELSTVLESTKIVNIGTVLLIALILSFTTIYMVGELMNENNKKKKMFYVVVTVVLFILAVAVFGFFFKQKSENKAILEERDRLGEELLIENINVLIKEVEPKFNDGSMTFNELKTHIESNPEFFLFNYNNFYSQRKKANEINKTFKKQVYERVSRDNPLYQQLIIDSKELVNVESF